MISDPHKQLSIRYNVFHQTSYLSQSHKLAFAAIMRPFWLHYFPLVYAICSEKESTKSCYFESITSYKNGFSKFKKKMSELAVDNKPEVENVLS